MAEYVSYCCICGRENHKNHPKGKTEWPWCRNPFLGMNPICDECLDREMARYSGDDLWNAMDLLCRTMNVAFVPERFTDMVKVYSYMDHNKGNGPAARDYLYLMRNMEEYGTIDWSEQNAKWEEILADQERQGEIHSAFADDERKRLKFKWGEAYSDLELRKLEEMYKGIVNSYGVGDEVGEDNARKLCMLSLEIDKCIASGGNGLDKLITPYNKLQANAGFTADNTRDANSFESMSELMLYMEKTGWAKKFVTGVPRDIVDMTLKDIQAHNTRLYRSESTIPDQVEEKETARKRIEELETRLRNEDDLDAHFDETWSASDDILFPNEDEEVEGANEEFQLDLDGEWDDV